MLPPAFICFKKNQFQRTRIAEIPRSSRTAFAFILGAMGCGPGYGPQEDFLTARLPTIYGESENVAAGGLEAEITDNGLSVPTANQTLAYW